MSPRRLPKLLSLALLVPAAAVALLLVPGALSAPSPDRNPSWWTKYQHLSTASPQSGLTSPDCSPNRFTQGNNVDVSCEIGPQGETSIALKPGSTTLVAGSNDIDRLPMRAWVSTDGGSTWDSGHDMPLPSPTNKNTSLFASDPGLAFDGSGNAFYSYIIVFFNKSDPNATGGIQGSEMAVARSSGNLTDWSNATFFNFVSGKSQFNDKPMIATDQSNGYVYVAWDTEYVGKSSKNNVILFSRSTDHGVTFSTPIALTPQKAGPKQIFAADPFVDGSGNVYVAYQDSQANQLMVVKSTDHGQTFGSPVAIASTNLSFDAVIPAAATRTPFVYPSCGAYGSNLYCSWMDLTDANGTDIFLSKSTDGGSTWGAPVKVNQDTGAADQFFQWLAVDQSNGHVQVSFYDTRDDSDNVLTNVYLATSTDSGTTFADQMVTTAQSDESAANSCAWAPFQYGDYEGIAAGAGTAYPAWTDGRKDCTSGEEIFSAAIGA